ncbi:efflux RND transporter periplasmic adaptor subunit [Bacteriovoracales bacterium]|nr:efflux RND transporter periplasmic adaptor subunit [Bacteriovoracales bacterium]
MFKNIFILFFIVFPLQSVQANKKIAQVFTDRLKLETIEDLAVYYGRITPKNIHKIYSPLEGLVTKIHVTQGARIKKGQTLATLKKNVLGMEINPLNLKSPINGFILEIKSSEHSLTLKNQHVLSLYDAKNFQIPLHLAPQDADKIKKGDSVTVTINNQKTLGFVRSLSQNIDPQSGTRQANIVLSSKKKIRPGQMAKVTIQLEKHKGILVSQKVLQKKENQYYLNLIEDDKVKQVQVQTKKRQKGLLEILGKNIKPDQIFITKSSQKYLVNGQTVQIQKP